MTTTPPITAFQKTNDMLYFARMLDKIRKRARGELREDFHENMGIGLDGHCVDFLRVGYDKLKERVAQGGSDEEILQWCFANGRELNAQDIFIWNEFVRKRGWNDDSTPMLIKRKQEGGFGERADILTTLEYFEYDEGRKA